MCHCSFNLWLPGDTEVYRLETKSKKKQLAERKGKYSQISLKQKIIKLSFSSLQQQRIRKEIDIGKLVLKCIILSKLIMRIKNTLSYWLKATTV